MSSRRNHRPGDNPVRRVPLRRECPAFQILYGVIIEDRQIRALLVDPVPDDDVLQAHAREAVARFLTIMRPE